MLKKQNLFITLISIIIPIVVAVLFSVRIPDVQPLTFLPPIYAGINGLTAICLVVAVWAVKNKKIQLHERLMKLCLLFSVLFLLMYVAYHMTSDSTPYGGEGIWRTVYFALLISHILLSIIIIPLVLITVVKALSNQYDQHRRIAKITFPIWLYVTISGVIVYWMISPYYGG
ncbi:MAG: DUF420 domain-containing protein [Capnocytophaga sp.]|nr:DUF420 domain-containing protein [Capnocytophaga sp.]